MSKIILDCTDNKCIFKLRDELCNHLQPVFKKKRPVIILCIGTDRSTGDSLGPLVGEKLKFLSRQNVYILGNLQEPIHAKNLEENIAYINDTFKNPYIIAIDACLGNVNNIGNIIIQDKPISPGAALDKNLPSVGNISIAGIVNISGSLEFMILQNTRLYTVMNLAEKISSGIYHSILKTIGSKKHSISNA